MRWTRKRRAGIGSVKAFTDEDVPLAMAVAAPPPLVVGAPAAPMEVQAVPAQPQGQ